MSDIKYNGKDKYILKLHELLWNFISLKCPNMHGNVVDCAEAVLFKEASDIKNDNEEMLVATLLEVRQLVASGSEAMGVIDETLGAAGYEPWKECDNGS
jgi:hypothetical protein|tara:strand:- start:430 stop:726 length:297 start_codon:yes stop_codon:yes gene_type:complete